MSRVLHVLMRVATVIVLLGSIGSLVVRAFPLSHLVTLLVAVASVYTPLSASTCLVLAAMRRKRVLSIAAAVILVGALVVQAPWYYFGRPTDVGAHTDIRLLSSNLRKGRADTTAFVDLAKKGADVITVSELTPEAVEHFSQAGINQDFPYSVLAPGPGAQGIGLWSRYPIVRQPPSGRPNMTVISARMRVPGVRFDPLVASVHIISPTAGDEDAFDSWREGIANTNSALTGFAAAAEPAAILIGGDFNSTPDMRQFRDLLTNGYGDAVNQTGAGFAPTFPSNLGWIPPFIVIDHVLTRGASASSIETVKIPGSDHRSLLASIAVPLDPTAS